MPGTTFHQLKEVPLLETEVLETEMVEIEGLEAEIVTMMAKDTERLLLDTGITGGIRGSNNATLLTTLRMTLSRRSLLELLMVKELKKV